MPSSPNPAKVSDFMSGLHRRLQSQPSLTEGISAVFLFDVEGNEAGLWTVEARNGVGTATQGTAGEPDATVYLTADVLLRLGSHELDGGEAFVSGQLTVSGDVSKAMLLAQIFGG